MRHINDVVLDSPGSTYLPILKLTLDLTVITLTLSILVMFKGIARQCQHSETFCLITLICI